MSPRPTASELPLWLLRSAFYGFIVAQARLRRPPMRTLFILGHMRSASSLLVHLLNSNPEIAGYGETHQSYETRHDVDRLLCRVKWTLRQPLVRERYVLDKVLHDRLSIADSILRDDRTYSIFLLREAQPTLASLIRYFKMRGGSQTPEEHATYYVERLATLARMATTIGEPQRALLLLEKDLSDRTPLAFEAMQRFLGTREPFREQYDLTPVTGQRVVGDTTEHIKAGKIVRDRPANEVDLPADQLARCEEAYRTCLSALRPHTISLGTLTGASGPMPQVDLA